MKTLDVSCSRDYTIYIGSGLFSRAGHLIKEKFSGKKVCVVTDENVAELYLADFESELDAAGVTHESFVFSPGEHNKTLATVEQILCFLNEKSFTRSDILVALGGGITGDITGFAASVYLRGLEFVQIPTTLLAAVDSSVGGKTGVNLGGLKNQVGTFWQPSAVICDPILFDTLPKTELASGMAEVIKYAAICDPSLGAKLCKEYDMTEMIYECVKIKRDIVSNDERDTGRRQLLNLGHTFGHGIEKVSDNSYTHGQAVAIGTVMAFRAAEKMGICEEGEAEKAKLLLSAYSLPTECPFNPYNLLFAMQSDKKRAGEKITLVLPRSFGDCILYRTDMSALPEILGYALGK